MLIRELESVNTNHIGCTHVSYGSKNYYVSTAKISSISTYYETEIFPCDDHGNVTDWSEIYRRTYKDEAEALNNHKYICEHLVEILEEGN